MVKTQAINIRKINSLYLIRIGAKPSIKVWYRGICSRYNYIGNVRSFNITKDARRKYFGRTGYKIKYRLDELGIYKYNKMRVEV